jgi:tetratricopeptide (TPR) repeat protein
MPPNLGPVVPPGWNAEAVALWQQDQKMEAIQVCLRQVNEQGGCKAPLLSLQLGYYLFHIGDFAAGAEILGLQSKSTPDHEEVNLNLAVCLSRSGRPQEAVARLLRVVELNPDNAVAWDGLAADYARLGRHDAARNAGTRALLTKDSRVAPCPEHWSAAAGMEAAATARKAGRHIISFSLWGAAPRYLRGALRNVLLAPDLFPGWTLRMYVDATVPEELLEVFRAKGVELVVEPTGQSMRERLAWRFKVADDPSVSRFLIRDVDSVFSLREALAVEDWLQSGKAFHVMRDWWTHTDLILAGMWGGMAGVLPGIMRLLKGYVSPHAETRNVDQWFLRDCIWPYVRTDCLVHDRYFDCPGSLRWPGPAPQPEFHVGQDEHSAHAQAQASVLSAWIDRYDCLGEPRTT